MLLEYTKKSRYQLIEESKIETEQGGLYRGMDLELQRTVAVKEIRIRAADRREEEAMVTKAIAEVRALTQLEEKKLRVPHIYDMYYHKEKKTFYIIMEWIPGTTLADKMKTSEGQFLQWMIDLCEILKGMSWNKLSHKDIKPANIMIIDPDLLYLIDFNISIGTPNQVEGTLHYKAPEMSLGSKYAGREKADMFSVGVLLYEFYTGSVPQKTVDYARNRSRGPLMWDKFVEPIEKNPSMSKRVNDIIVKCMKYDPRERYGSYAELKRALVNAKRR